MFGHNLHSTTEIRSKRTLTTILRFTVCACAKDSVGGRQSVGARREGGEEEREEWKSVKQEAYRFQVAVDNSLSVQQLETLEESVGKPSDECDTEPLKVVLLN